MRFNFKWMNPSTYDGGDMPLPMCIIFVSLVFIVFPVAGLIAFAHDECARQITERAGFTESYLLGQTDSISYWQHVDSSILHQPFPQRPAYTEFAKNNVRETFRLVADHLCQRYEMGSMTAGCYQELMDRAQQVENVILYRTEVVRQCNQSDE